MIAGERGWLRHAFVCGCAMVFAGLGVAVALHWDTFLAGLASTPVPVSSPVQVRR